MEQTIEQQVEARLAELPQDVRAAIQSADLTRKMQEIGTSHQLHLDQLTALEQEVMMVMLGFADPDDFATNVASEVHVPPDIANAVTKEVSEQIFLPIRESMKQFKILHSVSKETVPQSEMRVEAPVSAAVTAAPATPASLAADLPTAPLETASTPPATSQKPEFPAADVMLAQKTVTPPAPEVPLPTKPRDYDNDPYREPIEP